ncbi:hypothetical protein NDU88_000264 [Pleurodeles waltl]|uniref:C2H2-type domain-containing protein n=1 Tax=Pleurodeles waltl TaxID=8319 RepID=A0AAV7P971_PLEWA|nr:hypothetical protein NDU88_000264 [Pleurodeles waltl]
MPELLALPVLVRSSEAGALRPGYCLALSCSWGGGALAGVAQTGGVLRFPGAASREALLHCTPHVHPGASALHPAALHASRASCCTARLTCIPGLQHCTLTCTLLYCTPHVHPAALHASRASCCTAHITCIPRPAPELLHCTPHVHPGASALHSHLHPAVLHASRASCCTARLTCILLHCTPHVHPAAQHTSRALQDLHRSCCTTRLTRILLHCTHHVHSKTCTGAAALHASRASRGFSTALSSAPCCTARLTCILLHCTPHVHPAAQHTSRALQDLHRSCCTTRLTCILLHCTPHVHPDAAALHASRASRGFNTALSPAPCCTARLTCILLHCTPHAHPAALHTSRASAPHCIFAAQRISPIRRNCHCVSSWTHNGLSCVYNETMNTEVSDNNFGRRTERHQKVHSEENSYLCSECGKSYVWKQDLRRHPRTHTGRSAVTKGKERHQCKRRFSVRSRCSKQLGESETQCTDCAKTLSLINVHIKRHRGCKGKKPYRCIECENIFAQNTKHITQVRKKQTRQGIGKTHMIIARLLQVSCPNEYFILQQEEDKNIQLLEDAIRDKLSIK